MILIWSIIAIVIGSVSLLIYRYRNKIEYFCHHCPITHHKGRHQREHYLCKQTKECIQNLHQRTKTVAQTSESADDALERLRKLLPSNGIYNEQRRRLHGLYNNTTKNRNLCLIHCKELKNIGKRMEKYDLTANDRQERIDDLLDLAKSYITACHYIKLHKCIKIAGKIQHKNCKLLKSMARTERKLNEILNTKSQYPIKPGKIS